jgi:hypothetical protein
MLLDQSAKFFINEILFNQTSKKHMLNKKKHSILKIIFFDVPI